ncbi:hypothetical protein A2154_03270 [Candidatus Gottesmanbacteria bacterium RBG_16_43_7]|uniref:Large ribosomal subunit protein uL18 n=1 Tax=Candidatus Gottesmanbacteria bacterium RBG_16_43_7 TaxID=1798373 RepID=A0A1F5ZA31_9BACT|nr:MAG: hypothetical protein A2154_03270 [Candidatus Gottesmanbacteria bacterium RBG_16_43_7]
MFGKLTKRQLQSKRKKRVRARISGTKDRPRLSISKTNYALYAQLIDDTKHAVFCGFTVKGKNITAAKKLGDVIIKETLKRKIKSVVFDRSANRYHGVVKQIADTIRAGGIKL